MGDQLSSPPQTTRQRFRAHRSAEFTDYGNSFLRRGDFTSKPTTSSGEVAVLICWFELMNADLRFSKKTRKNKNPWGEISICTYYMILRISIDIQYTEVVYLQMVDVPFLCWFTTQRQICSFLYPTVNS